LHRKGCGVLFDDGNRNQKVKHSAILFVTLACTCALPAVAEESTPGPQHVLISFDGAHDLNQWWRSRALAWRTGARFTYFLSCTFLLSGETAAIYQGPAMKAGRSNVGFARSRDEVAARLRQIWAARREGHEIASHGCGHFDGGKWTADDWRHEHAQFRHILGQAWRLNGIPFEPEGWRAFADGEIVGFRAPYLAAGPALYEVLGELGFEYDASAVSRGPAEPETDRGLRRFALPLIPEGPSGRPVIAMDYNLFVRHSGGLERPSDAETFSERSYRAFMAAFQREYSGARRPVQLGFHFTLMNGGAYWDALERFAAEVCARPDVRCGTHAEYLKERAADPDDGEG
jgi:peptidoglycan/xylan/chitin deacetylase (PgdA/CDA1 family)